VPVVRETASAPLCFAALVSKFLHPPLEAGLLSFTHCIQGCVCERAPCPGNVGRNVRTGNRTWKVSDCWNCFAGRTFLGPFKRSGAAEALMCSVLHVGEQAVVVYMASIAMLHIV